MSDPIWDEYDAELAKLKTRLPEGSEAFQRAKKALEDTVAGKLEAKAAARPF